jgi:hypothetical protein
MKIRLPLTLCFLALATSLLPAASSIDPKALEALQRMSNTLAGAKALTVDTHSVLEVPAKTGQFLTLFSTAEVALKRPDKLRARLGGEAPAFDFVYDGNSVASSAPATKVYSVAKAPPTIDAMLSGLENETGIRFATAPLFFSNPYRVLTAGLTSAIVVGPATVHGVACEHFAFRSPGVNWEIWIETGAKALPRRLAVTFTDRTNFPRTLVEFSRWNLHPWLGDGGFVFKKPSDATEIPYLSVLKSAGR